MLCFIAFSIAFNPRPLFFSEGKEASERTRIGDSSDTARQKNAAQLDPLCRGEEDEMLCFIAFLCICVCAL